MILGGGGEEGEIVLLSMIPLVWLNLVLSMFGITGAQENGRGDSCI